MAPSGLVLTVDLENGPCQLPGKEIEAAMKDELPTLVELDDIRGELHGHSTWSDGAHTIAEMAEAAQALYVLGRSEISLVLKEPEGARARSVEVTTLNGETFQRDVPDRP